MRLPLMLIPTFYPVLFFAHSVLQDSLARTPSRWTSRWEAMVRKPSFWVPNVTGLLNLRGMLNRESESFSAILWGPVVNMGVTFEPQTVAVETENSQPYGFVTLTLWCQQVIRNLEKFSLRAVCVHQSAVRIP